MERLRKKDAEAGLERQPITDAQKAAIAEIRNVYEAKLAELDVMHQSQMRASVDPNVRATVEEAAPNRVAAGGSAPGEHGLVGLTQSPWTEDARRCVVMRDTRTDTW